MILTLLLCLGITAGLAALAGACWRLRRRGRRSWNRSALKWLGITGFLVTLMPAPIAGYLVFCLAAGQPVAVEKQLATGVMYQRRVIQTPRRVVIHVLEVAEAKQLKWTVTPAVDTPAGLRNLAGVATDAAGSLDADFLINANFFTPFKDNWFLDYRPHAGEPVEPIGPAISNGRRYGRPKVNWPSMWQTEKGDLGIGDLPADAVEAVTGRQWLVRDGKAGVATDEPPYPRTAIAVDADRRRLWLVVVDGKQPRYSEGLTLYELADIVAGLGAADAIELDGGGSSILVHNQAGKPIVLSRPCHTKIPGRQRPTGVFLGIRLAK